ncbi:MAG TPA: hypothetical protein VGB17_17500 [Pyrinomonadaceae bacterium]|jgi:hypothetical protein
MGISWHRIGLVAGHDAVVPRVAALSLVLQVGLEAPEEHIVKAS